MPKAPAVAKGDGIPAAKRAKAVGGRTVPQISGDNSAVVGEVRYLSPVHAKQAIHKLNGMPLHGSRLSVELAPDSMDKCKLLVHGIPSSAEWQEVKDHFAQIGAVAFADVSGGGRKTKTLCGEVRLEDPDVALQALQMSNGSEMMGSPLTVRLDPISKDRTKLLVSGIPRAAGWQELKDHFAKMRIPVAFCDINRNSAAFAGDTVEAEVRYETSDNAQMAVSSLDGSELAGFKIQVAVDPSSKDGSKLRVMGVNPTMSWQELKDHFAQCGPVAYAGVGVSKGAGGTKNGGIVGFGCMGEEFNMGSVELSNHMVLVPAAMVQQMISMINNGSMMEMTKPVKGGGKRKF